MSVNIYLEPEDALLFYIDNKPRLIKENVLIAENKEKGFAIYLTENENLPFISVYEGDNTLKHEKSIVRMNDLEGHLAILYKQYIVKEDASADSHIDEQNTTAKEDLEDNIYIREDELKLALCKFLQSVLETGNNAPDILEIVGEDIVDEMLDYFLEYIGFEHGFDIYRPMFVTDGDTGEEVYYEYPYSDIEENPQD